MEGTITISQDDRPFTLWTWLGFLALFSFITLHFAVMATGALAAIWQDILSGDFTRSDLIVAVGATSLVLPVLVVVYSLFYLLLFTDPFARGTVLLDAGKGFLILKTRHITGLRRTKSLSLQDVRDIAVTWATDEDGKNVPHFELTPTGRPFRPAITNPADAADLPAFAERLRAQLVALGWPGGPACGCPQGEVVPDRS